MTDAIWTTLAGRPHIARELVQLFSSYPTQRTGQMLAAGQVKRAIE